MSIQQGEGWHLWKKSMVMPRHALRRTVVSVPRRARLASVLVLLLTATGLLVTPIFGDSHEEIRGYGDRRMLEGIKRMSECKGNLDSVLKCQEEAYRVAGWTMTIACRQSNQPASQIKAMRVVLVARLGFTWRSWYNANCLRRKRFSAASAGLGRRQRKRKRRPSHRSVSSIPVGGMRVRSRCVNRVIAKAFP